MYFIFFLLSLVNRFLWNNYTTRGVYYKAVFV